MLTMWFCTEKLKQKFMFSILVDLFHCAKNLFSNLYYNQMMQYTGHDINIDKTKYLEIAHINTISSCLQTDLHIFFRKLPILNI